LRPGIKNTRELSLVLSVPMVGVEPTPFRKRV
jgi:hypothetical protein